MTIDDDIALAAEYVLGTLNADERAGAASRIASDPEFAAEVARWERRLGELNVMVGAVEPPASVWERITDGLNGTPRSAMRLPEVAARSPNGSNLALLRRRAARWRNLSGGLLAIAASLAGFVAVSTLAPEALPPQLRPPSIEVVKTVEVVKTDETTVNPGRFVAVLQQNADAPAFILTVDIAERSFVVRRVAAEPQAGKSYELWLVSTRFPAPRSLGVVGAAEVEARATLAAFDPAVIGEATYAVTVEPPGGSPTGGPTGPVVFSGKLIEAVPPQR